jgi:CRISPR-associated helicase Cas3
MSEDGLGRLWAKSSGEDRTLTTHLAEAETACRAVERRIGPLATVPDPERFWRWARLATMPAKPHGASRRWSAARLSSTKSRSAHRGPSATRSCHSASSAQVCAGLDQDELLWIAIGVVTHHRPLFGGPLGDDRRTIDACYGTDPLASCRDAFSQQVAVADHDALVRWLAERAGLLASPDPVEPLHARTARLLGAVLSRWRMVPPADGLTAVLLQGAVTMADHLPSAHSWLDLAMPLRPDYLVERERGSPGFRARAHQTQAAQVRGHVVVVAPTGSGKTEAALAWAGKQADVLPGQPRVFYVLPYLASIDAMAGRLEQDLTTKVGLSHSKAAQSILAASLEEEDAARKARARAAATRLFRERIRVGTPYQLLRGVLAGPAYASVLLDTANSVFVFDELHAYEARRFGWILATMRLWERLGGRIAITSATLPAPIRALVEETLEAPVMLVRADPRYADELRRHRVHVHDGRLDDPESITAARIAIDAGLAVLVIANTVRRAQEIYGLLGPAARRRHGGGNPAAAMLLHSRFRTRDRKRKEGLLTARYGTRPAGETRPGGLLVATQVVEVSLDVDFDILLADAAPLDALLQRFGRVNRLGHRPPADVRVFAGATDEGELVDGIYPPAAVALAVEILRRHHGQVVAEAAVEDWLTEVYESRWGCGWAAEVRAARDRFSKQFLTYERPFQDRADLADRFDKLFDGFEVLLRSDVDAYRNESGRDPLLAASLLIPMSQRWIFRYVEEKKIARNRVLVIDAGYDDEYGLDTRSIVRPSSAVIDTVL